MINVLFLLLSKAAFVAQSRSLYLVFYFLCLFFSSFLIVTPVSMYAISDRNLNLAHFNFMYTIHNSVLRLVVGVKRGSVILDFFLVTI